MIVITTPTGDIGRQVLANVLESHAGTVRVIVRDPARLPEATRDRVEIVVGSHADPAVVERAFAGAESVFWLVPADPRAVSAEAAYVDFARPACAAFVKHGVQRVIGISALGRGWPANAGHVTATLAMDDAIARTGVAYRALTCASFMDNLLRQVELIRTQGTFAMPAPGDVKAPFCATRDIAAAASRLLLDRSWTGVGSLDVRGPEDLSCDDLARIMSEVLGTPVRFQELPIDDLRARLLARGTSAGMTEAMVAMMVAKREGMDTMAPRTPESTTPTSFRAWCETVLVPALRGV